MPLLQIPDFLAHLHLPAPKSTQLHVTDYGPYKDVLPLSSVPISNDFYLLALKQGEDICRVFGRGSEDPPSALVFFDKPGSRIAWQVAEPWAGYHILIDAKVFRRFQYYSFFTYSNHEALFVSQEEEQLLLDIFRKAHQEYLKEDFSLEIIAAYTGVILAYVQQFHQRQFRRRAVRYEGLLCDFQHALEVYYKDLPVDALPSVSYFADRFHLSTGYFGDLIRHLTGRSAQDMIHDHILLQADMLLQQGHAVSRVAEMLGFQYPTYFTRLYRKKRNRLPSHPR